MAKFTMSNIAYGVGLALGYRGVVGIDVDTDDTAKIRAVISECRQSEQRSVVGEVSPHFFKIRWAR